MVARAADLLDAWENARHCAPPERALRLLVFARPDQDRAALSQLDLGARDWHLLRLREAIFGPMLSAQGACPHCGERIEVELDTRQLHRGIEPAPSPCYVDAAGRRYRLPNSQDLIEASAANDIDEATDRLFRACCVDAVAPADDIADVERGLSLLAAERSFQLRLQCELCRQDWQLAFDPGAFVWEEIQARAQALLDDIDCLARAYGWSERDILAMSDVRRNAYLQRVS